jgi:uncharacterized protein (TIGR02594 family)
MLPEKYKWLDTIGELPKMVAAALQYLGIREVKGESNNPAIMDMAKGLGVANIYTNDDMSWCALFINHLIRITGKPAVDTNGDKYNLLRALWMANWGNAVAAGDEKLGDVVVINREGGGHVFLYIAKTPTGNIIGLGGNQGDSVSFSEFDRSRVKAVRRFYATGLPASAKLYTMNSTGALSSNEA